MLLLLTSKYESEHESDDEEEDTSTQWCQRVIHPEAMLMTVINIYNLYPWGQYEYMKENVGLSMSFV